MSTMESAITKALGADATTDTGTQVEGEQSAQQPHASGSPVAVVQGLEPIAVIKAPEPATAVKAVEPVAPEQAPEPLRRHINGPQRIGAVLIVAACVAGAAWYVPRIVAADGRSFTGTVSSNGVTNLNFATSGLVGKISVQLGQVVRPGQVLATEISQSTTASISADRAAIAAAQATLAGLRAAPATATTQASIAAADAQLAKGEAQLAADRVKLSEAQIVAPSAGTVIAIAGQTGETVTSAGIRTYSSQSQTSGSQSPPFSLLPEGPVASLKSNASGSALPMIALRTSTSWEVTVLVPENATSSIRDGQKVTISVPAVGLRGLSGSIQQISPTPVTTSAGTAYEAVVSVNGHQRVAPLSGMTADVQLSS
jgi:multidrug efflux pump subunit AcrA (membrane-fusion protein)